MVYSNGIFNWHFAIIMVTSFVLRQYISIAYWLINAAFKQDIKHLKTLSIQEQGTKYSDIQYIDFIFNWTPLNKEK